MKHEIIVGNLILNSSNLIEQITTSLYVKIQEDKEEVHSLPIYPEILEKTEMKFDSANNQWIGPTIDDFTFIIFDNGTGQYLLKLAPHYYLPLGAFHNLQNIFLQIFRRPLIINL